MDTELPIQPVAPDFETILRESPNAEEQSSNAEEQSPSPSLEIFLKVQSEFLTALSPAERLSFSHCKSSQELLKQIGDLDAFSTSVHKGRLKTSLNKIKQFADKLQPYFDAISIIVQSHPEIAGIVWGVMRLSFQARESLLIRRQDSTNNPQLASHYVEFFEKLAENVRVLAMHLPQAEQVLEILQQDTEKPSDQLKFSLQQIYVDVFLIFQGVIQIFKHKNGKTRFTASIVTTLALQPFRNRFQSLLSRIEHHQSIIKHEVQLVSLRIAVEQKKLLDQQVDQLSSLTAQMAVTDSEHENLSSMRRKIESDCALLNAKIEVLLESHKNVTSSLKFFRDRTDRSIQKMIEELSTVAEVKQEQRVKRIVEWLNPPLFAAPYEEHIRNREPGTAQWLFETPLFKTWANPGPIVSEDVDSLHQRALWITGDPGSGKSVLAASAVDKLKGLSGTQCFYFFFADSRRMASGEEMYRSLLAQICYHFRSESKALDAFDLSMLDSSSGQLIASTNELKLLLKLFVEEMDNVYFVIDGIDECDDHDDVAPDLAAIFSNSTVKVLFLSRPNVLSLWDILPPSSRLPVGHSNMSDIRQYVSNRIRTMYEKHRFPKDTDESNIIDRLVAGADGMFLWAKLMLEYLEIPLLSPKKRLKIILEISAPQKLDDLYTRIRLHIHHGSDVARHLAQWIIAWLIYKRDPLSALELREAARMRDEEEDEVIDDHEFQRNILLSCACLIKKDDSQDPVVYRFTHLSAKEHVQRVASSGQCPISPSPALGHLLIGQGCLRYLTARLPSRPLSGTPGVDLPASMMIKKFPLIKYASLHWIYHLNQLMVLLNTQSEFSGDVKRLNYQSLILLLDILLSRPGQITAWIEAHMTFRIEIEYRFLIACSERKMAVPQSLQEFQTQMQGTIERLRQLALFLKYLEQSWGSQLFQSRSVLWIEIPACNPSEFVCNNEYLQVDTMAPQCPSSSKQSLDPLKTISETSHNGLEFAVLSIWPSRTYHLLAKNINYNFAWTDSIAKSLHEHSNGWIARYQIYSIQEAKKSILDIKIDLAKEKVWLQIRQSLWREGQGTAADTCRLQFPASISRNLHCLTILGEIYTIRINQKGSISVDTTELSLDFNQTVQDSWSPQIGYPGLGLKSIPWTLDSSNHRNSRLYLYWVFLSPDGRYAFFLDKAVSQPNNLAIYDISTREGKEPLPPFNHTSMRLYGGIQEPRIDWATFHHSLPLLLFTVVGTAYLWAYHYDNHGIQQVYYGFSPFESATFSSCGSLIVLKPVSELYPITMKIPSKVLDLMERDQPAAQAPPKECQSDVTNISAAKTSEMSDTSSMPAEVIKGIHVRAGNDGTSQGVTAFRGVSNNVTVHLWDEKFKPSESHKDWEEKERSGATFELAKLPSWLKSDASFTMLPQTREKNISFILEQARQPWANLSVTKEKQRLPALVMRDADSINVTHTAEKRDSRLLVESAVGESMSRKKQRIMNLEYIM